MPGTAVCDDPCDEGAGYGGCCYGGPADDFDAGGWAELGGVVNSAAILAATLPAQPEAGRGDITRGNLVLSQGVTPVGGSAPAPRFTSNTERPGPAEFGYWNHKYSTRVDELAGGDVNLTSRSGTVFLYQDVGGGQFEPTGGALSKLVGDVGGWTETEPGGRIRRYDGNGRLESLRNSSGARWTLSHDVGGKISYITDPAARRTTYVYDGSDKIQRIVDVTGRITTFTVDGSGDLTKVVTPALCETNPVYDNSHRIIGHVQPAGRRTAYSYDVDDRPSGSVTDWMASSASSVTVVRLPSGSSIRRVDVST